MTWSRKVLLAACCLCLLTGWSSCGGGAPEVDPPPPPPPADRPAFDRTLAFAALEAQCNFGARTPGSDAHAACGAWLKEQLEALSSQVVAQEFRTATPMGGPYDFANYLAVFPGADTTSPLFLAAHWDSRPVADQDPEAANRTQPVMGANDGASGVAVLLELARLMKARTPSRTVIVGFLDAEDSGKSSVRNLPYMGFCLGADFLATHWPAGVPEPAQMILLDMVGADSVINPRLEDAGETTGPVFKLEANSLESDPALVDQIWTAAEALGHSAFSRSSGGRITDDHMPFADRGTPAVDIIHFAPAEWHTVDDTPEHCSADTLWQVGDTLVSVIWTQ
jgi:glutaminyl-peptide cyclotransferase